ncbi:Renal dipeptidase [Bacillus cereus]|uniref:nucleotidyltransferase domain-containing protein n=1 Tax=Bacillus sp. AW TaxID=2293329 RepID=UPI000BFAAB6B|nr:nucleotidyltransferase family protein [Bacillus wiedmannii]PFM85037.1 Renal dipeptidase [Bacillus cereus]RFB68383.1 Renal dipeptidase [Bacillus sp. AW]PFQ87882.1 Renal dipeptidase [Bacillus cereus]PGP33671.1 Renal dipeptidase [Bacillus cereus]
MHKSFCLDTDDLSKELKLLLEILKMEDGDDGFQNRREWLLDIDWDEFVSLAMHHRVYPSIYSNLKSMGEERIPDYVVEVLYQQFKKNTFQMLYLGAEMERLSKMFFGNEIRTLFLKGPILAHDLYGDISLRTSCDLDILIPIQQLERVEKLLVEEGYVKDEYIQTILNDWKWRHHHVTFFHHQKHIKVEIHWRLHPGPGKEPNFEALWERKRKSSLGSYPVYLLGREDLFCFLVSHGARHGWSRLRWLVDIHQMLKQNLNWSVIKKLFKKYQNENVGGQALILVSELLNATTTEEMIGLINRNRTKRLAQGALFYLKQKINLHTPPVPDDVAKYHSRHLFWLMSNRQRIVFMISHFYPYPIDAKTLPLPKSLHFLYFPLRPILCAWRKTRKYVFS